MYMTRHVTPHFQAVFNLSGLAILWYGSCLFGRARMASFETLALIGTLPAHVMLLIGPGEHEATLRTVQSLSGTLAATSSQ